MVRRGKITLSVWSRTFIFCPWILVFWIFWTLSSRTYTNQQPTTPNHLAPLLAHRPSVRLHLIPLAFSILQFVPGRLWDTSNSIILWDNYYNLRMIVLENYDSYTSYFFFMNVCQWYGQNNGILNILETNKISPLENNFIMGKIIVQTACEQLEFPKQFLNSIVLFRIHKYEQIDWQIEASQYILSLVTWVGSTLPWKNGLLTSHSCTVAYQYLIYVNICQYSCWYICISTWFTIVTSNDRMDNIMV